MKLHLQWCGNGTVIADTQYRRYNAGDTQNCMQANKELSISQKKAKCTIQENIKTYHAVYNTFTNTRGSQVNYNLASQVEVQNNTNKHTTINFFLVLCSWHGEHHVGRGCLNYFPLCGAHPLAAGMTT